MKRLNVNKNDIIIILLNLDIVDILNAKMDKTDKKYPLEKSKGVSTKYDKL